MEEDHVHAIVFGYGQVKIYKKKKNTNPPAYKIIIK